MSGEMKCQILDPRPYCDSPSVKVVQEMLYDFIGVSFAGESPMDKIDTKSPYSFLLQLSCVVQHSDVDQDGVWYFPTDQIDSVEQNARPAELGSPPGPD